MKLTLISLLSVAAIATAPGLARAQTTGTAPADDTAKPIEIVDHGSVEQQQLAPEPEVETRARIGLVISGAVLFGVSWVVHAAIVSPLAGILDEEVGVWDDFRYLGAIPLAGPWIQMAVKPTGAGEDGWVPYLIVDGILQVAGLTMLILGLTLRKEVGGYADAEPSFQVGPMLGEGAAGLSAFGRF